jgi:PEP-CTERM motif
VALDRNNAGVGPVTFATSALGYDAADIYDSGTYWNNVYFQGGVGQTTSLTGIVGASAAIGDYQILYGVSLLNSTGAASGLTVSASIHVTGVDSHVKYTTANTPSGATGLLANPARLYSGGDSVIWTLTGLVAGNQYNLFFYGVGGSAGQGAAFTLAAPNDASSGVFTAQTTDGQVTGNANNTFWDGSGNVINGPGTDTAHTGNNAFGISWVELNGVADSSGDLIFTESKATSGVDYFEGFQIQPVPEPSAFALAGLGLIGFITMNYRRRINR